MGKKTASVASRSTDKSEKVATLRRLSELDWDFFSQKSESLFSDLHWHPCRYPSQIPAIAIARLTRPGDVVLDPFVGSGTTLVEAQRLGRSSVGIDINPTSCLIASAKVLPQSAIDVQSEWAAVQASLLSRWKTLAMAQAPEAVQLDKWYSRQTQRDLRKLWSFIHEQPRGIEAILRSSFSGILLSVCREERHWGYVCDNTEPAPDEERVHDVLALFVEKVDKHCAAYAQRDGFITADGAARPLASAAVVCADITSWLPNQPSGSFDAFVTSPPYYGVADYVKAQRLTGEWFGIEIEPARRKEIGARSKRHRNSAFSEYVKELDFVFRELFRVLKPRGWGLIVFGESNKREPVTAAFIKNLKSVGFEIELQKPRSIAVARRFVPSLQQELVIIVRKPG